MTSAPVLLFRVIPEYVDRFNNLLQRGFLVPVERTVPLREFLEQLPGVDQAYISNHIETIFVNGIACDSLEHLLEPGDTIALSAAMPGLAGAIFRRGGLHGSLRSRATVQKTRESASGYLTVKLFNRISADRGEEILRNGALFSRDVLERFLDRQQHRILPGLHALFLDNTPLATDGTPVLPGAGHFLVRIERTQAGQH